MTGSSLWYLRYTAARRAGRHRGPCSPRCSGCPAGAGRPRPSAWTPACPPAGDPRSTRCGCGSACPRRDLSGSCLLVPLTSWPCARPGFPPSGELTETDAAQPELAQQRARPAAALAARTRRTLNFGSRLAFSIQAVLRHVRPPSRALSGRRLAPERPCPAPAAAPCARSSRSVDVTTVMSIPWIFSTLS